MLCATGARAAVAMTRGQPPHLRVDEIDRQTQPFDGASHGPHRSVSRRRLRRPQPRVSGPHGSVRTITCRASPRAMAPPWSLARGVPVPRPLRARRAAARCAAGSPVAALPFSLNPEDVAHDRHVATQPARRAAINAPRAGDRGVHRPSSSSCPASISPRARAHRRSGERFPLANSGERFFTDPPPPLHQSGATGPRVSTERPQPPLSPPRSQGSSSPFSLSWSSSSSSSSMASPSGSWRGSYMREDDIERLVRLRRIPRSVITRAPGVELEPTPEPDERVVFGAHLDRGLGLPASAFFRRFLDHFGLQPHHLPANACVLLSCFVAPTTAAAACGALDSHPAWHAFLKIPTAHSVKNWQMSFFYVRNEGQLVDRINLPEFNPAPPVGRINWSHNARSTDQNAEVNLLWDFLATAATGGLTAEDLLCTIAERRVLPLQMRTHKIGHMSGRFDPNRTSKVLLNKAQVASRVNHITKANLSEDWSYGLAPCDRDHPPARLFERQNAEDGDLATKRWTPDHVDPADQTGETAGDDDLPQAPDLGGQGEHNPPPSPEQQEDEEPATSATGPIPAVPLRGGGSRQAPRVVSPLPRQRREQTPQPSSRAPTPPPLASTPPAPQGRAAVPPASAPIAARAEPARPVTRDDMLPGPDSPSAAGAGSGHAAADRAGAEQPAPPATEPGAGRAVPPTVVLTKSPEGDTLQRRRRPAGRAIRRA
ncbi:hypothetical protein QYE76_018168 [Lolium multiflorum]|uniref:Transposase (putative) gypsy type domain-containing protein n=1 Tax=Lolium multiflorum TaxID=4521 RepID=A0AAD8UYB3_LOLMU|nr:hypothetical protein QYE76_018168 [Lolium multiflorum]